MSNKIIDTLEQKVKENLKEGMIVKNYKEMCLLLGEKNKGGNSKKHQIEIWRNYFQFRNEKYSFIIEKIYEEPEISAYHKQVYKHIVKKLICNILIEEEKTTNREGKGLIISKKQLFERISLINHNFKNGERNISAFSIVETIPIETINNFYRITYKRLNYIVTSALKDLQNQCIIKYDERTHVCAIRKDGSKWHREATSKELSYISTIAEKYLKIYNCESMQELCKSYFKYISWKYDVNRELNKKHNIRYYYKMYHLGLSQRGVQLNQLPQEEFNLLKMEINKKIQNSCLMSARKSQQKTIEYIKTQNEEGWGDVSKLLSPYKQVTINSKYESHTQRLIDICIDVLSSYNLALKLSNISNENECNRYTFEHMEYIQNPY